VVQLLRSGMSVGVSVGATDGESVGVVGVSVGATDGESVGVSVGVIAGCPWALLVSEKATMATCTNSPSSRDTISREGKRAPRRRRKWRRRQRRCSAKLGKARPSSTKRRQARRSSAKPQPRCGAPCRSSGAHAPCPESSGSIYCLSERRADASAPGRQLCRSPGAPALKQLPARSTACRLPPSGSIASTSQQWLALPSGGRTAREHLFARCCRRSAPPAGSRRPALPAVSLLASAFTNPKRLTRPSPVKRRRDSAPAPAQQRPASVHWKMLFRHLSVVDLCLKS
jgi:hypothetical protein